MSSVSSVFESAVVELDTINQGRKYEWKIKKAVADTIIANGGSLFGGAVRDMYMHDTHADMYYEKHIIYTSNTEEYKVYEDVSYLPETYGRVTVPNDIDACISEKKFESLLDALNELKITLVKKFERDPSGYLRHCTIVSGQVKHYSYSITSLNCKEIHCAVRKTCIPECLKYMPGFQTFLENMGKLLDEIPSIIFDLDLMVISEHESGTIVDAPFGNLDFECNGLIMDSNGIRLSKHIKPDIKNPIKRQGELARILDDVFYKKAVMCERATLQRTKKMYIKGWMIHTENIIVMNTSYLAELAESVSDDGSSSTGGHCIICHEDCQNPHLKLKCCDARYHPNCLKECWVSGYHSIHRTKKCPMCRTKLSANLEMETDIMLIQALVPTAPNAPSAPIMVDVD